ncbi:MAG: MBL fold metallo-hydrolase [Methanomassiliicoccales archaeon]
MTIRTLPGKGYDCNVYFISGNRPMIVDTGTGAGINQLLSDLDKFTSINLIKSIILTHRHYDHVGGAAFLSHKLGSKVFIHNEDAEVVSEGDAWATMSIMFGGHLEPLNVVPIEEGMIFNTGDHEFRVIHTPGHSAGSICLYDSKTKDLISGDTIFKDGVGRWDLPSGDQRALYRSIQKLMEFDIKNLYPGHGPCGLGCGNECVEQALNWVGEN